MQSGALRQGIKQGWSAEGAWGSGQVGIHQWGNPCHSGPSHTSSSPPESPLCWGLGLYAVRCSLFRVWANSRRHVCCEENDCSHLHARCLAENESQNWISSRAGDGVRVGCSLLCSSKTWARFCCFQRLVRNTSVCFLVFLGGGGIGVHVLLARGHQRGCFQIFFRGVCPDVFSTDSGLLTRPEEG